MFREANDIEQVDSASAYLLRGLLSILHIPYSVLRNGVHVGAYKPLPYTRDAYTNPKSRCNGQALGCVAPF